MSADILRQIENLPNGTQVYLCPVAPVWGGVYGFSALGYGLRFTAFRLIARVDGKRIFDHTVPFDRLDEYLNVAPSEQRDVWYNQRDALIPLRSPLSLSAGKSLNFARPRVMGILNATPDSFSDGGDYLDVGAAIAGASEMLVNGADIIDIGGESTRPGATPVWEGEEQDRVLPIIAGLKDQAVISLDTRNASVMGAGLQAGAHIINDVSALTHDDASLSVAANSDAPIVLMHAQGDPTTMQDAPFYKDVLLDVYDYLAERVDACIQAGIDRSRLIIDPGFGFGKRVVEDNLALLRGIALFHTLGLPVLVGMSRKRFVGAITNTEAPKERMAGSVACAVEAARHGVQIVRVHDVAETVQALKMHQGWVDSALMDFPVISD